MKAEKLADQDRSVKGKTPDLWLQIIGRLSNLENQVDGLERRVVHIESTCREWYREKP